MDDKCDRETVLCYCELILCVASETEELGHKGSP